MKLKYTHLALGEEYPGGIAGRYIPEKEVRLKFDGREVLYVIGSTVIDGSCCGAGEWKYAIVPGYIINWQKTTNEAGQPVSDVEPVLDKAAQDQIREIIKTSESADPIGFW